MEHHVYFWLKAEHDHAADRARFEAGMTELSSSPRVASGRWGRPAPTEARDVTDHSWHYALSFRFDSLEQHLTYQASDPHHMAFVDGFGDWWERVLVMDLA
jgi:hypothetical protein